jgi:SpoVK/Ycf46/Vps4 family AAA+-type ATPase
MALMMVTAGRCQFCHRTAEDVAHILAGDSGFICDECVQTCVTMLKPNASPDDVAPAHVARYAFQRLVSHFAPQRPNEVQTTSRTFPIRQQADLQRALDALLGERRVTENFIGFQAGYRHEVVGYSRLIEQGRNAIELAPPQHEEINIGRGETVRCLKNGLWFLRDSTEPYAVVLSKVDDYGRGQSISLEVAAPPGVQGVGLCTRLFEGLERQLSTQSCYRGRVLSLEDSYAWSGHAQRIQIHDLDPVRREDLILPEATLRTMLNRLLNELDGLRERADVFFILTTNRPTMLEPALVTRRHWCIRQ